MLVFTGVILQIPWLCEGFLRRCLWCPREIYSWKTEIFMFLTFGWFLDVFLGIFLRCPVDEKNTTVFQDPEF